ncbi:MAG: FAD:protein FMN transferase [Planctomycetota bacterium]
MHCSLVCLSLLLAAPPAGPAAGLSKYQQTQAHMGTSFTVVLYAPDEPTATRAFTAAFARIQALDEKLSDYRDESELSRLSAAAPTPQPVPLSEDLFRVLSRAQAISGQSEGAFDVTVGPLTRLWRRSRRQRELPTAERLQAAREATGYQHLVLDQDRQTARLERPGMRLDLGGIGQGFAADEALATLRKLGLPQALVNGSGDLAIGDPPPGEKGWKVAIAPLEKDAAPSRFLLLANTGISTSGDAFQFVEIDGQRYSHIVHPKTGLGLTRRMSVTVIARDGTLADAWATAFCVLGPERALALCRRDPSLATLFVQQGQATIESDNWPRERELESPPR